MFRKRSKRLRKNVRSFKRKTIDLGKYVSDFYLENGLAYISCNVKGINDIISRFSVRDYEWVNPEFVRFVEENAYYIPVEYPIVLEICGATFTPEEQQVICSTLADYYSLKLGDKKLDLDANRNKALILLAFGVLFFGVVTLLNYLQVVGSLQETILILFWFFIWEFGDVVCFDHHNLRQEKIYAAQLACLKVIFSKKFTDAPVDNEKTTELMAEIFPEDAEEIAEEVAEEIEESL